MRETILRWTKMSDTQIEDILKKGDKDKDGYFTNIICICIWQKLCCKAKEAE